MKYDERRMEKYEREFLRKTGVKIVVAQILGKFHTSARPLDEKERHWPLFFRRYAAPGGC